MSLFMRIIQGELPAKKVYEDTQLLVIWDINPQAPVHLLLIPKTPWRDLQSVPHEGLTTISHLMGVAQQLALEMNLTSYRLVTNCGEEAGQTIFHLHFHLLGGRVMRELG